MSRLFVPYRSLGFICSGVPFQIKHCKNQQDRILLPAGNCFNVFFVNQLSLTSVSDILDLPITCMVIDKHYVYCASGSEIFVYWKLRHVKYILHGHTNSIKYLVMIADKKLLSVDGDGFFKLWNTDQKKIEAEFQISPTDFEISSLCYLHVCNNKILLGGKDGSLQLWNIRKVQCIYHFKQLKMSTVTVIQQLFNYVDDNVNIDDIICAIGFEDGCILLHNIQQDKSILRFRQTWGAVTSLVFTEVSGNCMMISGSGTGHITVWDLAKRTFEDVEHAHRAAVTHLHCINDLLISCSNDNSLKVWNLEPRCETLLPRLLFTREGHTKPPHALRFYTPDKILSGGLDSSIRVFSLEHPKYDGHLGRAYEGVHGPLKSHDLEKQFRVMTCPVTLACSGIKQGQKHDWDDLCVAHDKSRVVTTWNVHDIKRGKYTLDPALFRDNERLYKFVVVTCVFMTSCGNFVVIGYSSGHAFLYNIQSGLERGSYGDLICHDKGVSGVAVNLVNTITITAGSDDAELKFWKFKDKSLIIRLSLNCSVHKMVLHSDSDTLAVALRDSSVCLYDAVNHRLVRRFCSYDNDNDNNKDVVSHLVFSDDAQLLITATNISMANNHVIIKNNVDLEKCIIRTWNNRDDILIDCFVLPKFVTSLAFSPNGEFLATCHSHDLSIYLWSNKSLYNHLMLDGLPRNYVPSEISILPKILADRVILHDYNDELGLESHNSDHEATSNIVEIGQDLLNSKDNALIRLSGVPESHFKNLTFLDAIKEKHGLHKKTNDAPQIKGIPFFLPPIENGRKSVITQSKNNDINNNNNININSNDNKKVGVISATHFLMNDDSQSFRSLLSEANSYATYLKALEYLESCGPSLVHIEVQTLSIEYGGSISLMIQFLNMLYFVLSYHGHVDSCVAYLQLFRFLHEDIIIDNADIAEKCVNIDDLICHISVVFDHDLSSIEALIELGLAVKS